MGDNDFCCSFSRSVNFCQGVTGVNLKCNVCITLKESGFYLFFHSFSLTTPE